MGWQIEHWQEYRNDTSQGFNATSTILSSFGYTGNYWESLTYSKNQLERR
jgi:hypothetical protein